MNKVFHSAIFIIRIGLSLACFAYVAAILSGNLDWVIRLGGFHFMFPLYLLFGTQLILPLLLPWRKCFIAGSVLYIAAWAVIWSYYSIEVSQDINADSRGMTGALFFAANGAFMVGVTIRLLFRGTLHLLKNKSHSEGFS